LQRLLAKASPKLPFRKTPKLCSPAKLARPARAGALRILAKIIHVIPRASAATRARASSGLSADAIVAGARTAVAAIVGAGDSNAADPADVITTADIPRRVARSSSPKC
jgi:hypothetical protein